MSKDNERATPPPRVFMVVSKGGALESVAASYDIAEKWERGARELFPRRPHGKIYEYVLAEAEALDKQAARGERGVCGVGPLSNLCLSCSDRREWAGCGKAL